MTEKPTSGSAERRKKLLDRLAAVSEKVTPGSTLTPAPEAISAPEQSQHSAGAKARRDLHEAIDAATDDPTPDIGAQAEALAQQSGETLPSGARERLGGIRSKLNRIAGIMRGVSAEERDAIQNALKNPSENRQVPDTPATREIRGILASIDEAANSIAMPAHMRQHSKLMTLRPVGESAKVVLEGGILTLIANGLLSAVGIVVTPYSTAHALTYVGATFGVGLVNMTTISDRVLRPAAEGSLKPLVQKPGRPGISLLRTGSSTMRVALLGVSVVAGIGMAQDTIRKTYTSSRIAGGIAAPLDAFAAKKIVFERQLTAFSRVPGKILEIAGKIEAGKPVSGSAPVSNQEPLAQSATIADTPQLTAARQKLSDAEEALKKARTNAQKTAGNKAVTSARAALAKLEAAARPKALSAPNTARSQSGAYAAWSPSERAAMVAELRTAFAEAGMDATLADKMIFADPEKLGFGRDAKFKHAIRTGDTTDLPDVSSYPPQSIQKLTALVGQHATTEEYVQAIRKTMGLKDGMTIDERMAQIIREFFAQPIFETVNQNWEKAQRFGGMIKRQGEDVLATGERAFLHGAEPIGPETVVPFASAIIAARADVDKVAKEKLIGKVKEVFDTMQDALSATGASVTLATPEPLFDTSDIQTLKTFLERLITDKAKGEVTKSGTQNAVEAMTDKFIPGGKKWEETKRWIAVWLMQSNGYFVQLVGEHVRIYESTSPKSTQGEAPDISIIDSVSNYYGEWVRYLKGKEPPVEWKVPRTEIERKSNEDLGAEVRPQLEELAEERKRLIVTEPHTPAAAFNPRILTNEEIGKIVKEQVETQRALGQKPIIVSQEIWDAMKKGTPPPGAETVDMSKWRELTPEATQRVLTEYESAAAWRGILYLGGGVGGLILGIMLLSFWPVYRLNKKLRAAAPDFEKELDEAERTIAEGLNSINDSFAAIPVLSLLPRMDSTMMHAALRLAAEELYPATVSENPSAKTQIWHTVKESFSRGPYAHRVEEIMSLTDLIEKLQTNKSMQRRLSDIIAPNVTRAESMVKKLPALPNAAGDTLTDMQAQLSEMSVATAEIFRNAARGNLGFRIAVITAQIDALKLMLETEKSEPRKIVISDEQLRLQRQLDELTPTLKRLDADDLYARMSISHKKPRVYSGRADAMKRADNPPTIVIPPDLMTSRRYSVPRGIIDDVRSRIDSIAPATLAPTT